MAPRKRATSSKSGKAPAEPAEKEASSPPQTNGHSSPEAAPPAKRSKRTEQESEAPTANGKTKGSKKTTSKTPETIPEDSELNTGKTYFLKLRFLIVKYMYLRH